MSADTTARDALVRNLCARLSNARRSEDELRAIDDFVSGLERGADIYGPLDVTVDGRDWREEAAQEHRDLLVYMSAGEVARQHRRRERIACREADELAAMPVDRRLRDALIELRDSQPVIGGHR